MFFGESWKNAFSGIVLHIAEILQDHVGFSIYFNHRMHGGTWNKRQDGGPRKMSFFLTALGDGSHQHATWNPTVVRKQLSFPTAEEAAHPILLCKRVVTLLVQHAVAHGEQQPETLDEQAPTYTNMAHWWIMDMLPKGKNYVIVCEFQFYGGTGTKANFYAAAETSELFIDNYNGGSAGRWRKKV